ncbi:polysaccharide biosynthesis/export family protein [Otariodibacter oris]|uniref:Polysaccharide export outer membrane protein n=1 Tax=Otariodibacter oris TaxID=1032623 RepID=A0A420XH14_9PAST|nr:polysaccharide biosynthesis/export family protein [Otariodibacter oris]QGM80107.1 sugar ABC transporter substrate-binding protein [Otariodibacter oris]RKR71934.1 polysaccharide export outer membrane protein [Otariodibacter oris]
MMKKSILLLLSTSVLISCSTLPTSGPSYSEVLKIGETQNTPEVDLINLDLPTAQKLFQEKSEQSLTELSRTAPYTGTVNVGDVLDISIWEAPPAILFGSTLSANSGGSSELTKLPEQMVNQKGRITIPFVGDLYVKGKTPETIQNELTNRLSTLANEPQVVVRVIKNNSANVSVIREGNSIRMPLTPYGERVLDAVASVGGVQADLQDVTVQVMRGSQVKSVAFEKLLSDPLQNIPLYPGDVISLLNSPLSFTGLGALGTNKVVRFSTKGLSLAEAIGQLGGLVDRRSDPRSVFVFRYIPFNNLSKLDQSIWRNRGYTNGMNVPTVYNVNLLQPTSLFVLQHFPIKDKDVVYVSNAPLAEFQKFISLIFSISSPVTSTINSANGL